MTWAAGNAAGDHAILIASDLGQPVYDRLGYLGWPGGRCGQSGRSRASWPPTAPLAPVRASWQALHTG